MLYAKMIKSLTDPKCKLLTGTIVRIERRDPIIGEARGSLPYVAFNADGSCLRIEGPGFFYEYLSPLEQLAYAADDTEPLE